MQRFSKAGANTANLSTMGNVALEGNNVVGTVKRKTRIGSVQNFCIHVAAQSDYEGGAIKLIQGAGDTSSLSANLDWGSSSSFSSYAAMADYLKSNKMIIDSIRIVTDSTDNFEYKLSIGFRNPNNRNNPEEDIELSEFTKSQGDGLSKYITIDGLDLELLPSVYLTLSNLKVSTYVKIYFNVTQMEQTGDFTPIKF